MKRVLLVLIAIVLFFALAGVALAEDPPPPFEPGDNGPIEDEQLDAMLDGFELAGIWDVYVDNDDYEGGSFARCLALGWAHHHWKLNLDQPTCVTFQLEDLKIVGDYYQLWIDGVKVGETPKPESIGETSDPAKLSRGTFKVCLPAGLHAIEVFDRAMLDCGFPWWMCAADFKLAWTLDREPPVIWYAGVVDGDCYATNPNSEITFGATDTCDPNPVVTKKVVRDGCWRIGTFTATDCSGNVATETIRWKVDGSKPSLEITWPTEGELVCGPLPDAPTYTASDNCGEWEKVYAKFVQDQDDPCTWYAKVRVKDPCGNVRTRTVTFRHDTEAPVVQISGVEDGACYYTEQDPSFIATDNCGDPQASGAVTSDGCTRTYTVTAVDACGNETVESVTWTVDHEAPRIEIIGVDVLACYATEQQPTFSATDNCGDPQTSVVQTSNGCMRVYEVTAVDSCGNVAVSWVTYYVDGQAPTIVISGVADGACYDGERQPTFTASDNCGEPQASAELTSDGCSRTYTVTAVDACGNETVESVTYTVDGDVPPEIEIIGVEALACYDTEPQPTFIATDNCGSPQASAELTSDGCTRRYEVTAVDSCGNAAVSWVTYYVDGQAPTIVISGVEDGACYDAERQPTFTATDNCGEPQASGDLTSDGCTRTYTVTAVDACGNETVESVTWTVDNEDPVVTIEGADDGACYQQMPTITYTATDNCGVADSSGAAVAEDDCWFVYTATAVDACGHTASASIRFMVDAEAPMVTIAAPADGAYYTTDTVPAAAYQVDDNCDGSATAVEDGYGTIEGVHTYSVTATDCAGNVGSGSVTYTVDNTPPTIGFNLGAGQCYDEAPAPEDLYTVSDAASGVDSVTHQVTGGPCQYLLTVTATDAVGNSASQQIAYVVDGEGPTVTITGAADGACYAAMPTLGYETDDNCGDVVASEETTVAGCLATYTVTAQDDCGNVTVESITFTVDGVAPTVSITAPADGACYRSEDVPAGAYETSDNCGVVTIDEDGWSDAEGVHTYAVTVTDCAGNQSSASVTYTVDNTAPDAEITAPADGASLMATVSIEGSYDEVNPTSAVLRIDGEVVAEGLAPTWAWEWDTTKVEDGVYTIELTVGDCAGNETTVGIWVEVDNTVPAPPVTLAVDAPGLGGVGSDVTVMGLAEDNARLQIWIKGPGEVEFRFDGSTVADDCGHWRYSFAFAEPGLYTFRVGAHDLAGNWTWSREFELTLDPSRSIETLVLQDGTEAIIGSGELYDGTRDTWIGEWGPDESHGLDGTLAVRYAAARSGLVAFDLAEVLPGDAQVELAMMGLYALDQSNPHALSYQAYGLTATWDEMEATYNQALAGTPWEVPGARGGLDRLPDAVDEGVFVNDESWYAFDVTALADDWAADASANQGVSIVGNMDVSVQYDLVSSDHPDVCRRPVLYLVYSIGPAAIEVGY